MAQTLSPSATKVIQYLNEAYGKEKELEIALQAHIKMAAARASYKKRLQDHLKETKAQAKGLERRIKQLGGKAEAASLPGPDVVSEAASKVTAAATQAVAASKAPLHALRGTGVAEKLLKNAKTELWNEHEEIGHYLAIETLAQAVGDRDTAQLAREFRRQEERMANFLTKLIPQLTKAVVTEEVPPAERRGSSNGRARSRPAKAKARPAKSAAKRRPARAKPAAKAKARPAKSAAKSRPAKARPAKARATAKSRPSKARPAKRRATSTA